MKQIVFTGRAKLDLDGMDRGARLRVIAAIERLVQANTGNIKKLQGIDPPEYRLRVGDWRVRFDYPDVSTVRVNRIQNRKDAYR